MKFKKPKLKEDFYKGLVNKMTKDINKIVEASFKEKLQVDNNKLKTMYQEWFNGYNYIGK